MALLVLKALAGLFLFLAPIIDEVIFVFVLRSATLLFITRMLLVATSVLVVGVALLVSASLLGLIRLRDFAVLSLLWDLLRFTGVLGPDLDAGKI